MRVLVHTCRQSGHGEGDADDSLQILNGNQRPQDGSDADGLSFTGVYQLRGNDYKQERRKVKDESECIFTAITLE